MDGQDFSNSDIGKALQKLSDKFNSLEREVASMKSTKAAETAVHSEDDSDVSHHSRRQWAKEKRKQSRSHGRDSCSPPRQRHKQSKARQTWADRMSADEDEMDYGREQTWQDSDDESHSQSKLVSVSEKTKSLLAEKCSRRVINTAHLEVRKPYPLPKVVQTKTPQLDSFMKEELSSTAKAEDKELAKIQTFVLDALAPLTAVLEASGANEGANELSIDEVVNATTAAVALIGNASANITHLRCKKAIHSFNKELASLVSDDKEFKEAAPALFGTEFPKRAKERTEQVKAMRSSLTPRRGQKSFFRGGPSARRGGYHQGSFHQGSSHQGGYQQGVQRFGRGGAFQYQSGQGQRQPQGQK